jgi:hypothetical protein
METQAIFLRPIPFACRPKGSIPFTNRLNVHLRSDVVHLYKHVIIRRKYFFENVVVASGGQSYSYSVTK